LLHRAASRPHVLSCDVVRSCLRYFRCVLFLLTTCRPPLSTLFPYTTLFRSRSCLTHPPADLCSGQTAGDGGTQSQGVSHCETARLPEVRTRPHALSTRARGFSVPRERGFVSLASGSRAHDVGQAITPQGQLWGVCF